jgi:hypothetical protein
VAPEDLPFDRVHRSERTDHRRGFPRRRRALPGAGPLVGRPRRAILIEPAATNTAENLTLTRELLAEHGINQHSVMLISRPYQQCRAFATCRKVWPEVDVICSSTQLTFGDYVMSIGDPDRVINMLVGDTQRIEVYAERVFAVPQPTPEEVRMAFRR